MHWLWPLGLFFAPTSARSLPLLHGRQNMPAGFEGLENPGSSGWNVLSVQALDLPLVMRIFDSPLLNGCFNEPALFCHLDLQLFLARQKLQIF
jgi:hypothetical protein